MATEDTGHQISGSGLTVLEMKIAGGPHKTLMKENLVQIMQMHLQTIKVSLILMK